MRVLPLLLVATPAAAERLVCDPVFVCSDQHCYDTPGFDEESADYVDDALGPAPQVYLGEGSWMPATRTDHQGTLAYTGTSPQGDAIMLSVAPVDGTYLMVRREPGAGGRVWIATGKCEMQP